MKLETAQPSASGERESDRQDIQCAVCVQHHQQAQAAVSALNSLHRLILSDARQIPGNWGLKLDQIRQELGNAPRFTDRTGHLPAQTSSESGRGPDQQPSTRAALGRWADGP